MINNMKILNIFTDGGARGNPGPAGIGVHVENQAGASVYDFAQFLGVATNNIAEYKALLAAVSWLEKQEHVAEANFFLDSKLVVEQISRRWKIKEEHLQKLASAIWQKLAGLKCSYKFTHIPREKNQLADALANSAMDSAR